MGKRRLGVIAIVAVVAIALVWWLRHGDDSSTDDDSAAVGGRTGKIDPRTGKPIIDVHAIGDRRIAGTVMMNGAPVAGASVFLASRLTLAERRVVTDAAGKFDFGMQSATAYTVVADKPRVTAASRAIDLRNLMLQFDALTLTLYPCDASIHGTIRDSAGGPIAKAHVAESARGDLVEGGVEADDQGNYELCLPMGGSGVVVDADGYARVFSFVAASGRLRRDFSLVPEAIVVGRVVRADDKSPVGGAIVDLEPTDFTGESLILRHTTSDPEGRFRIDGLVGGRYSVTARTDRLATARPVDAATEVGKPEDPIVCALVPTLVIAGKVVDGERAGVGGVQVFGISSAMRGSFNRSLQAITLGDGTFALEQVVPGEYTVAAEVELRTKRQPTKVQVTNADVRDVVIEIDRGGSIAGRVLYDGKPADGVSVRAENASTTSDQNGQFELRQVSAGRHELYAESKRLGAFTRIPALELAAGERKTGVEIQLDLAGSIAGVVVDQNGAPVDGAHVSFSLIGGRDFGEATTAEDGSFRAGALSGGGEYAFEVRASTGATVLPPVDGKRHPRVAVANGQTHVTGVRVRVRYERLAIAGKVVSERGAPVPDVFVRAEPGKSRVWSLPTATTDVTGAFVIRDLPAGSYTVRATSTRSDQEVTDVSAGRRDVVIRLPEPATIEGTLDGFGDGVEVTAWRYPQRRIYRAVVTGKTFVIRDVAAGTFQVFAREAKLSITERVEVASGATAKVTLRNPGIGTVVGTAIEATTRRPVAGMRCYLATSDFQEVTTAASGEFRAEDVLAGNVHVTCNGPAGTANGNVTLAKGETARIELLVKPTEPKARGGYAGLELEDQMGEVLVSSVAPGGPAQRAGVQVGDTLLQIDGEDVKAWTSVRQIESKGAGATVKLKIERSDKESVVELKLDARKDSVDDAIMNGD